MIMPYEIPVRNLMHESFKNSSHEKNTPAGTGYRLPERFCTGQHQSGTILPADCPEPPALEPGEY
jgi:hypothetical protein